mmetsp:Transcript_55265/g.82195  ORF Transcript_55265/g.82195 Transcript_55265/m.82195 type:complete len:80 (+) Transcript_55265:1049-1288(+)
MSQIRTDRSSAAVQSRDGSFGWNRTRSTGAVWPMRAVYSRVLFVVVDDESIVQILARRSKEEAKERKVPVLFHDTLRDV